MTSDAAGVREGRAAPVPEYDHVQGGFVHWVLWVLGGAFVVVGLLGVHAPAVSVVLVIAGVPTFLGGFLFCHLSVRDEGDRLNVRFGPVRLLGTRIRYADIESVETARSGLIDGLGIHWIPGRGMIYNISGYDCVRVALRGGKTVRVGTDEPERLAEFLRGRMVKG